MSENDIARFTKGNDVIYSMGNNTVVPSGISRNCSSKYCGAHGFVISCDADGLYKDIRIWVKAIREQNNT